MIHFATNNLTPRLEYVLSFIFQQVYDVDITYWNGDIKDPLPEPCIYYGEKRLERNQKNVIRIPKHKIMDQKGIFDLEIWVKMDKTFQLPYFFGHEEGEKYDLPFDLFAMIFYLISRYEEYLPHQKDKFGRYTSDNSLAVKNHFIEYPLIDNWLHIFIGMVQQLAKKEYTKKQNFEVFSTIDIDSVWAYAYKGSNHWKGAIKDLLLFRFSALFARWKSVQSSDKDPFYTFDYLDKIHQSLQKIPRYFVLYSKNPDNLDINHKRDDVPYDKWLHSFTEHHDVGLHPSFQSHQSLLVLQEEKLALEKTIMKPIIASRQHYIVWTLPETFRALLEAGVQEDYSMGYPERVGYRASTGYSFFWYDILAEKQTPLLICPFQIMDVTMKKYMKWTPDQALIQVRDILIKAAESGSPVRCIWHNSSFFHGHGWGAWQSVFEFLLSFKKSHNQTTNQQINKSNKITNQ